MYVHYLEGVLRVRIDSDVRCSYVHENYARCLGDLGHYPTTLHSFWIDGKIQDIEV